NHTADEHCPFTVPRSNFFHQGDCCHIHYGRVYAPGRSGPALYRTAHYSTDSRPLDPADWCCLVNCKLGGGVQGGSGARGGFRGRFDCRAKCLAMSVAHGRCRQSGDFRESRIEWLLDPRSLSSIFSRNRPRNEGRPCNELTSTATWARALEFTN